VSDEKNVFALGKIPSNKQRAAAPAVAARPATEFMAASGRDFIEAARTHTVPAPEKVATLQSLDPQERLTRGINIRFNDYELALLRHLAERQERSMHQTIKRLLIPAARELLEQLESEPNRVTETS
jgi:hypothetical protein